MAPNPSQKRYPPELRERAVRMVLEAIAEQGGERFGIVTRVPASSASASSRCAAGSTRRRSTAHPPRPTTEEQARIAALEKENAELRRANEILKSAAVFFGAELDRRRSK